MKHLKCKILNFDNALYYGEDIRINVRNKVINSITVYIPLDSRPSAIIDIYDTITGYTVKDLYPYEILTKLESYYPLLKDIHRSDLYNPQMYLSIFSVNCDTDAIIIAAEYGKCYSHNSYGIAGVSNWHIDSERSKLFATIQGYLFASDNKELNNKGDNNMKLEITKITKSESDETLYIGDNIEISVKDKIINNIKVYLPLNWKPIDIFAIYDTITGHVPDYNIFPCMVLPVSEDLYPYTILTKLEILLPYLKRIYRSELDNPQIYLTNIDMHYDNDAVEIKVYYAKCRPCFPHALDLDVRTKRAKLFNLLFTDNTTDKELNKGDNNMKIERTIDIGIKAHFINNIKVYIPSYWKLTDILTIYNTITGYMGNDTCKDTEEITEDDLVPLYSYMILDRLEKYFPHIKDTKKSVERGIRIWAMNMDLKCENDTITITVNYTDQYSKVPKASVRYDSMTFDRNEIFNIALRERIKNSTYGAQIDEYCKRDDEAVNEAFSKMYAERYLKELAEKYVNSAFGVPTFEAFDKITDELKDTYIKKNHDYGNSFDKSIDKFGLTAAVVRMSDKMERLSSLLNKDAKVDESIRDTVMDLANYCIMTAMYLDNKKENK